MSQMTQETPRQSTATPGGWRRDLMTLALCAGISVAGGFGASNIHRAAAEGRAEQRLEELDRRVVVVEGRLEGVEALRRDVARLEATVTAQTAALDRRLGRIEDRLDHTATRDL